MATKKNSLIDNYNFDSNEDSEDTLKQWGFDKNYCFLCKKVNSECAGLLMQCGKCKAAYYCSMKCFNDDLENHQKVCCTDRLQGRDPVALSHEDFGQKKKEKKQEKDPAKPIKKKSSKKKKTKKSASSGTSVASSKKPSSSKKSKKSARCKDKSIDDTDNRGQQEVQQKPDPDGGTQVTEDDSKDNSFDENENKIRQDEQQESQATNDDGDGDGNLPMEEIFLGEDQSGDDPDDNGFRFRTGWSKGRGYTPNASSKSLNTSASSKLLFDPQASWVSTSQGENDSSWINRTNDSEGNVEDESKQDNQSVNDSEAVSESPSWSWADRPLAAELHGSHSRIAKTALGLSNA